MLVKNHLQFHHSYRWYKPFPDMDGLWHFSNINHPLITIIKLILYLYALYYMEVSHYGTWTPKWSKKLRLANKRPTSPTSENVFWRPAIDPMPVRRSRGPAYDWEDWEDWDKGSWPQGFPEVFNIREMGLTYNQLDYPGIWVPNWFCITMNFFVVWTGVVLGGPGFCAVWGWWNIHW